MKNISVFLFFLMSTFVTGFSQTQSNNQAEDTTTYIDREIAEDEIREFGRISKFEDVGYPMYSVTVEFPERLMEIAFNLNVESSGISLTELEKLKGKYAVLYYRSEAKPNIYDITYKGKSLLLEYAPKTDPTWETVTGILSGAKEATAGDLPDQISVTDVDGVKTDFEYFITPEIAKVNGKLVKVFFTYNGVQTITYLRASKN